jgi:hypothetical protein
MNICPAKGRRKNLHGNNQKNIVFNSDDGGRLLIFLVPIHHFISLLFIFLYIVQHDITMEFTYDDELNMFLFDILCVCIGFFLLQKEWKNLIAPRK